MKPDYYEEFVALNDAALEQARETEKNHGVVRHRCNNQCTTPCSKMFSYLQQMMEILRAQLVTQVEASSLPPCIKWEYMERTRVHFDHMEILNTKTQQRLAMIRGHICSGPGLFGIFGPVGWEKEDWEGMDLQVLGIRESVRSDMHLANQQHLYYVRTRNVAYSMFVVAPTLFSAELYYTRMLRLISLSDQILVTVPDLVQRIELIQTLPSLPDEVQLFNKQTDATFEKMTPRHSISNVRLVDDEGLLHLKGEKKTQLMLFSDLEGSMTRYECPVWTLDGKEYPVCMPGLPKHLERLGQNYQNQVYSGEPKPSTPNKFIN